MELKKNPLSVVMVLAVGLIFLGGLVYVCQMLYFSAQSSVDTWIGGKGEDGMVSESPSMAPSPDMDYVGGGRGNTGKDMAIEPGLVTNGGDGSKIVKSASMSMTVADFDSTVTMIKEQVKAVSGFVQNLSDTGTDNNRRVILSVRVPSDKFDEMLGKIKALGVEVEGVSENSDDISETYMDLQARLKTQKALEKQYLELLDKATKVDDILAVQRELAVVRQNIEMYESQMKFYDNQSDMSYISVSMTKASEALDVTGDGWRPFGVVVEAFTALVGFGKTLLTLAIWVLIFSPVVLVPYWIFKMVKKEK
ncbi:DUF4349 domain-containing protein [bacterium]|nr:DUF4349 domain-containing protein [bacterium]